MKKGDKKAPGEAGQIELFAGPPPPANAPKVPAAPESARPDAAERAEAIRVLLEAVSPIRAGSREAAWLKDRRIFRKTWLAQGLRMVDHYRRAADALLSRFGAAQLAAWGLFNKEGHLRFYKHTVLAPWLDAGRPVYLQAFAPDGETVPPELSLTGPVPCPYNARLLDGTPGRLYLRPGVLETLEFLEAGFPAVGVPEGTGLKSAWIPRFRGKSVYIAFDAGAEGEAAAAKAIAALTGAGIEAHRLKVPAGKDVGGWLARGA